MSKPLFDELLHVKPGNELYVNWLKYAISITEDDVRDMVDKGLTYQINALKSMIKEIIAGGVAPEQLFDKLDKIAFACERKAQELR